MGVEGDNIVQNTAHTAEMSVTINIVKFTIIMSQVLDLTTKHCLNKGVYKYIYSHVDKESKI